MNRTCYVVCNSIHPSLGGGGSGPGIRAEQLAAQARLVFNDVKYLFIDEIMKLSLPPAGLFNHWCTDKDTIIVRQYDVDDFISRQSNNVFVFSQVQYRLLAEKIAEKNVIVYDYLACKDHELLLAGRKGAAAIAASDERKMVQLANRIFHNGSKKRARLMDYGASDTALFNNPFVPASAQSPSVTHDKYFDIFFGGKVQPWTSPSQIFRAIADFVHLRPDARLAFIFEVGPDISDDIARYVSEFITSMNVTRFNFLDYSHYRRVCIASSLFLDWSPHSLEREYSTSIRVLQSVSEGTPVMTNSNTDIGWFNPFPGVMSNNCPTSVEIDSALEFSKTSEAKDRIVAAQNTNRRILTNTDLFDGL